MFTATGQLNGGASTIGDISGLSWTNGATQAIPAAAIDFAGTVQFAQPSFLFALNQDGFAAGTLNAIAVDAQGNVNGSFTNGVNQQLASIAMANFNNVDDLDPLGSTLFARTWNPGAAQAGTPGQNGFRHSGGGEPRTIYRRASAGVCSLLTLQRAFQVNSRVITTAEQMYSIAAELKVK